MPSVVALNFNSQSGLSLPHRMVVLRLHRAPVPEEEPLEPLPGDEPTPEDEELPPHPDPSVQQLEACAR